MLFIQGVVVAFQEFRGHKLRTFLTLLGNIVSVMSLIAIVSIIDGANSYIEGRMAGAGSGLFQVRQRGSITDLSDIDTYLKSLRNPKITFSDFEYIQKEVPLAEYMDANITTRAEVRNHRLIIKSVSISGRTEIYPMLEQYTLRDGRHFAEQEVRHARYVAVIGFDVAEQLYPSSDPIGKKLRIAGFPFTVVGVLDQQPRGIGSNPNLSVIVPVSAFGKAFGAHQSLTVSIKPVSLDRAPECMNQAQQAMRTRRGLMPKQEDNFGVVAEESWLDLWKSITSDIALVLVAIVSISIVVNGIIIMNMMLISVTERTWEIGIRKATGATRGNILWQFLIESATLSMVGGAIGIFAGFIIAALVAFFSPLPYAIKLWAVVTGLSVTFVVGMFFGAYPAAKAARLDPIEALRYE